MLMLMLMLMLKVMLTLMLMLIFMLMMKKKVPLQGPTPNLADFFDVNHVVRSRYRRTRKPILLEAIMQ